MLILKWYSKPKSDENWGFFGKKKVSIYNFPKNLIFPNKTNPQFSSDFDLLYHFGISICKFHNKILI